MDNLLSDSLLSVILSFLHWHTYQDNVVYIIPRINRRLHNFTRLLVKEAKNISRFKCERIPLSVRNILMPSLVDAFHSGQMFLCRTTSSNAFMIKFFMLHAQIDWKLLLRNFVARHSHKGNLKIWNEITRYASVDTSEYINLGLNDFEVKKDYWTDDEYTLAIQEYAMEKFNNCEKIKPFIQKFSSKRDYKCLYDAFGTFDHILPEYVASGSCGIEHVIIKISKAAFPCPKTWIHKCLMGDIDFNLFCLVGNFCKNERLLQWHKEFVKTLNLTV